MNNNIITELENAKIRVTSQLEQINQQLNQHRAYSNNQNSSSFNPNIYSNPYNNPYLNPYLVQQNPQFNSLQNSTIPNPNFNTQEQQQPQNPSGVTPQNLEDNIRQIVKKQLEELAPIVNSDPRLVKTGLDVMSVIGSSLSSDNQVWLSSNLEGLPHFLKTSEGSEIVGLLIDSYQKHLKKEQ